MKLSDGRARQASGATNRPTNDAHPPLRARMGSPRVASAAWFAFVVGLVVVGFAGAPSWVMFVAWVPFAVVLLFGASTEMKARRRRLHRRPIGAHPGPDEENKDDRSTQPAADDGAPPSASLARPQDGAPGAVPAMSSRLQPPDDDEATRTTEAKPTRPRLRWSALSRTPGAERPRPRPRWTAVRRFGSAVRAGVRADPDQRRADRDRRRADQAREYVSWAGISEPRPGGDRTLLGEPVVVFRAGVPLRSLIRKASR